MVKQKKKMPKIPWTVEMSNVHIFWKELRHKQLIAKIIGMGRGYEKRKTRTCYDNWKYLRKER